MKQYNMKINKWKTKIMLMGLGKLSKYWCMVRGTKRKTKFKYFDSKIIAAGKSTEDMKLGLRQRIWKFGTTKNYVWNVAPNDYETEESRISAFQLEKTTKERTLRINFYLKKTKPDNPRHKKYQLPGHIDRRKS